MLLWTPRGCTVFRHRLVSYHVWLGGKIAQAIPVAGEVLGHYKCMIQRLNMECISQDESALIHRSGLMVWDSLKQAWGHVLYRL